MQVPTEGMSLRLCMTVSKFFAAHHRLEAWALMRNKGRSGPRLLPFVAPRTGLDVLFGKGIRESTSRRLILVSRSNEPFWGTACLLSSRKEFETFMCRLEKAQLLSPRCIEQHEGL